MKNYEGQFKRGWDAGPGVCGEGSLPVYAEPSRERLREVCASLEEKMGEMPDVLEIGCGDLMWHGDSLPSYVRAFYGIDVETRESWSKHAGAFFSTGDAQISFLPRVDLAIARLVFIHLSNDAILRILDNLRKSGTPLLLASSHPAADNSTRSTETFHIRGENVNLAEHPFYLPMIDAGQSKAQLSLFSL